MKPKPAAVTVLPWLKSNLGRACLAPLTGTDMKALLAAVQTIELYSYHPRPEVLDAFAALVRCMQPYSQEMAYHAIAHVMDWGHRPELWAAAGLPTFTPRRCKFEH